MEFGVYCPTIKALQSGQKMEDSPSVWSCSRMDAIASQQDPNAVVPLASLLSTLDSKSMGTMRNSPLFGANTTGKQ